MVTHTHTHTHTHTFVLVTQFFEERARGNAAERGHLDFAKFIGLGLDALSPLIVAPYRLPGLGFRIRV